MNGNKNKLIFESSIHLRCSFHYSFIGFHGFMRIRRTCGVLQAGKLAEVAGAEKQLQGIQSPESCPYTAPTVTDAIAAAAMAAADVTHAPAIAAADVTDPHVSVHVTTAVANTAVAAAAGNLALCIPPARGRSRCDGQMSQQIQLCSFHVSIV